MSDSNATERMGGVAESDVKVYFVGAGPGAADLLTIRGRAVIERAGLILYADSLVHPSVLDFAAPGAVVEGTSGVSMEEYLPRMVESVRAGVTVARLHSGDPSIYGAISEQMAALRKAGVAYEVVPGVSSAFAAAAILGAELTVPGGSQTVILTRSPGRTGTPPGESVASLASHGATMVLFLSITHLQRTVNELLDGGYSPETPAAIVYRASWPDEAVLQGTLETLVSLARRAGFSRQALILVGDALRLSSSPDDLSARSHLYDPSYTHRFRSARRKPGAPKEQIVDPGPTVGAARTVAVVARSRPGVRLAAQLCGEIPDSVLLAPASLSSEAAGSAGQIELYSGSVLDLIGQKFHRYRAWICCIPMGIVVRALGRAAVDKRTDPAVVVVDESGKKAVSVLSGHLGGADDMARRVAAILGGEAVITSGSHSVGTIAPDLLGKDHGWVIATPDRLTAAAAALVNGDSTAILQDSGERDWWPDDRPLPPGVRRAPDAAAIRPADVAVLAITRFRGERLPEDVRKRAVIYHPPVLTIGIGCERGVSSQEIARAVRETLEREDLAEGSVMCLATIDLKANESGLIEFARSIGLPLHTFTAEELNAVEGVTVRSDIVFNAVGAWGVAEPAAILASGGGRLLAAKSKHGRVTAAVAMAGESH